MLLACLFVFAFLFLFLYCFMIYISIFCFCIVSRIFCQFSKIRYTYNIFYSCTLIATTFALSLTTLSNSPINLPIFIVHFKVWIRKGKPRSSGCQERLKCSARGKCSSEIQYRLVED